MSRRRKPLPVLEGVTICDVGAEGNAIAKVDGMVLFVPFAAPGDVVDVRLRKKKKSYAEGTVLRLVEAGPVRIAPICEHFTVCGGCRWQHLPYDFQLKCKQQQVVDALTRIAKVELPEISPILGSKQTECYRNKMEYTFSNRCWLTDQQLASGE